MFAYEMLSDLEYKQTLPSKRRQQDGGLVISHIAYSQDSFRCMDSVHRHMAIAREGDRMHKYCCLHCDCSSVDSSLSESLALHLQFFFAYPTLHVYIYIFIQLHFCWNLVMGVGLIYFLCGKSYLNALFLLCFFHAIGRVCHAVMQVVYHFPTYPHDAVPNTTPVMHYVAS